jgi:hypothetical protein
MHPTLDWKRGARWVATFVGFPLAGLAARAVAGNIDTMASAALGGLAAGLTLGAVQALALGRSRADRLRWVGATGLGLAAGLTAGAATVGYGTATADLVVMGALSGAGVGLAQAAVLTAPAAHRIAWAVATPALWALGWLVTVQVIVDAERQHATFGASGALLVAVLSAVLVAARPAPALVAPATPAAPVTAVS